jgi:hypothetical protein
VDPLYLNAIVNNDQHREQHQGNKAWERRSGDVQRKTSERRSGDRDRGEHEHPAVGFRITAPVDRQRRQDGENGHDQQVPDNDQRGQLNRRAWWLICNAPEHD